MSLKGYEMKNLLKLLLSVLLIPAHTLYADEEVNVKPKTEDEKVEADEAAEDADSEAKDDAENIEEGADESPATNGLIGLSARDIAIFQIGRAHV